MARLIAETPILKGKDAVLIEKLRKEVWNLSRYQRAENTRKLNQAVAKAMKYISISI